MPAKHEPSHDPAEPYETGQSDFVTRADLKAQDKPSEPTKTVNLRSPQGAKVTTSEANAQTLKDAGFS